MSRTTPQAVIDILAGEYDNILNTNVQPYIDTASAMVDAVVAADGLLMLGAGLQEIIERWLSAHYYQIGDPGYQSRTTAAANGTFNGQTTQAFKSTRYGQQALALDLTGFLARRDRELDSLGRRMVQVAWLGGAGTCEGGIDTLPDIS